MTAILEDSVDIIFHGIAYNLSFSVADNSPAEKSIAVDLEDLVNGSSWHGEFSTSYIENMTGKTGSFKKFDIFVQMLNGSLRQETESVFLDVLTHTDLEELKLKRAGKSDSEIAAAVANIDKAAHNHKRFLIMTYAVEFDRVHYPLSLLKESTPTVKTLQRVVRRLRRDVQTFKSLGGAADSAPILTPNGISPAYSNAISISVAGLQRENAFLKARLATITGDTSTYKGDQSFSNYVTSSSNPSDRVTELEGQVLSLKSAILSGQTAMEARDSARRDEINALREELEKKNKMINVLQTQGVKPNTPTTVNKPISTASTASSSGKSVTASQNSILLKIENEKLQKQVAELSKRLNLLSSRSNSGSSSRLTGASSGAPVSSNAPRTRSNTPQSESRYSQASLRKSASSPVSTNAASLAAEGRARGRSPGPRSSSNSSNVRAASSSTSTRTPLSSTNKTPSSVASGVRGALNTSVGSQGTRSSSNDRRTNSQTARSHSNSSRVSSVRNATSSGYDSIVARSGSRVSGGSVGPAGTAMRSSSPLGSVSSRNSTTYQRSSVSAVRSNSPLNKSSDSFRSSNSAASNSANSYRLSQSSSSKNRANSPLNTSQKSAQLSAIYGSPRSAARRSTSNSSNHSTSSNPNPYTSNTYQGNKSMSGVVISGNSAFPINNSARTNPVRQANPVNARGNTVSDAHFTSGDNKYSADMSDIDSRLQQLQAFLKAAKTGAELPKL